MARHLESGLTDKQYRFCHEYMIDCDGAKAAVRAGYSTVQSNVMAHRLLNEHPKVGAYLQKLREEELKKFNLSKERVINELIKIAFSDISDFVIWDKGKVILNFSEKISKDKTAAISEVKKTQSGVSIKLHSKIDALDKLCKHLGLYKDPIAEALANRLKVDLTTIPVEKAAEEYQKSLKECT